MICIIMFFKEKLIIKCQKLRSSFYSSWDSKKNDQIEKKQRFSS